MASGRNLHGPCQGRTDGQERQERPHSGPNHFGRERLAEDRDAGGQSSLQLGRPPQGVGETKYRETRYALAEIVDELDRWHSSDSANEEMAFAEREVRVRGPAPADMSDAVAVVP